MLVFGLSTLHNLPILPINSPGLKSTGSRRQLRDRSNVLGYHFTLGQHSQGQGSRVSILSRSGLRLGTGGCAPVTLVVTDVE